VTATLFDSIGGAAAVALVVDRLYERLVGDQTVGHQFEPSRLPSLKAAQRRWFQAALSGASMQPSDLERAHAHLEITDEQVNAVLGHLDEVLSEAGVDMRDRRAVMAVVSRLWTARRF
jgi:hemoglobin